MRRFLGIACGLLTHAFFFATLPPLYRFLRNDFSAAPAGTALDRRRGRGAVCHPAQRAAPSRHAKVDHAPLAVSLLRVTVLLRHLRESLGPVRRLAGQSCYRLGVAGKLQNGRRSRLFPFLGDSVLWSDFDGARLPDGSHALVALGAGTARSAAAVSSRRNVPILAPSRLSQFFGTRLADAGRHARSCRADRPVDRLRRHWQLPQRRTPFPTDRGAVPAVSKRGAGLSLTESTWIAGRQSSKPSAVAHSRAIGR